VFMGCGERIRTVLGMPPGVPVNKVFVPQSRGVAGGWSYVRCAWRIGEQDVADQRSENRILKDHDWSCTPLGTMEYTGAHIYVATFRKVDKVDKLPRSAPAGDGSNGGLVAAGGRTGSRFHDIVRSIDRPTPPKDRAAGQPVRPTPQNPPGLLVSSSRGQDAGYRQPSGCLA
jgi:hypothetical protein